MSQQCERKKIQIFDGLKNWIKMVYFQLRNVKFSGDHWQKKNLPHINILDPNELAKKIKPKSNQSQNHSSLVYILLTFMVYKWLTFQQTV